jgi:hypothetical protein
MEIYTNSVAADRVVTLDFHYIAGATINAWAYLGDEQVYEFTTAGVTAYSQTSPNAEDFYTLTLPLFLCQFDQRVDIHWEVTYLDDADDQSYTVSKITPVNIVTPILTKREIKEVWDTATNAEVVMIEKAVRHIIQSYTGQEFGRFIGVQEVKGTGSSLLGLPRRLLSIETFDGVEVPASAFSIEAGGYTLRYYPWGVPPVKADYYGLHMHTGGVIHNPNHVKYQTFAENRTYKISGHWGWESVPDPVREAAKLLVNDYACADAQYRDRYLVSMTAADWRIQFYSGAYLRTGNVRADQLLADYVVTRGWGVI